MVGSSSQDGSNGLVPRINVSRRDYDPGSGLNAQFFYEIIRLFRSHNLYMIPGSIDFLCMGVFHCRSTVRTTKMNVYYRGV
jgi:hypothetical protein